MTPLVALALALAAPPDDGWRFVDASSLGDRSALTFRTAELADKPAMPLHPDDPPPAGAKFGSVPLGVGGAFRPALVWHAASGALWFDADGDGRFAPAERHTLGTTVLEVKVAVPLGGDAPQPRTLLVRRRGDGVAYAVRGYTTGAVTLGGKAVKAALTDGDADGCFDRAGADRVWLDLDGDGAFDPLTEQFPLGTAVAHGGTTYLLRPRPDGLGITVRERPAETGTLTARVQRLPGSEVVELAAQYVSEFGELVVVRADGRPTAVPAGRYRVETVRLKLTDGGGKVWHYAFATGDRAAFDVEVAKGRDTVHPLLSGLRVGVSVYDSAGGVRPGAAVLVQPDVTAGPLYLTNCEVADKHADYGREVPADLKLTEPGSVVIDRAASGFL